MSIAGFDPMLEALDCRHAAFHEAGCRASDHGLEQIYAEPWSDADVAAAFDKVRRGQSIDAHEVLRYKSALLATFFDRLDDTNQLTKTILYNLNPRDNELFATMIGNFQDGSVPGKMQYGSSWWFLDPIDGMTAQMRALSNMGLFSRFVGMVTDSPSFLSYSRHEYFRRLVCNFLGDDVRLGRLPDDRERLGRLAQDVSFFNARDYLGVELGALGRHEARAA